MLTIAEEKVIGKFVGNFKEGDILKLSQGEICLYVERLSRRECLLYDFKDKIAFKANFNEKATEIDAELRLFVRGE